MSKLLIWFQQLPEKHRLDSDPAEALIDARLTAYRVDNQAKQIVLCFDGNFHDFLNDRTLYEHVNDVVVFVPARTVLYQQVQVPGRSRNRVKQAIPFLVEDYLLEDSSEYFFAPGRIENGKCNVAIVSRAIMDFLYQAFSSHNLPVSFIGSEMFMFHEQQSGWTVRNQGDYYYIIESSELAYAIEKNNIEILLKNLFAKNCPDAECDVKLVLLESDKYAKAMQPVKAIAEQYGIEHTTKEITFIKDSGLKYWPMKNNGINLLQDEYQLKKLTHTRVPYLKFVLALSGLWLLSQAVFMGYQWYYYKTQAEELEQRLEQEFFNLFPDAKRLIDVRVQTLNRLGKLTDDRTQKKSFLYLLAQAGNVLKDFKGVEIVSLQYHEPELVIELRSREFIFNKLKQRLSSNQQLLLTEQSSSKDDKGIHTVIRLKYTAQD